MYRLDLSTLITINILLLLPLVGGTKSENDTINTTYVNLSQLTEVFSNEKLPNSKQETNRCFPHIGCIEKIPIKYEPRDPLEMKTAFEISNRQASTKITYELIRNCLQDSKEKCELYPYNLGVLLESGYNPKLRTVILIPGYRTKADAEWQFEIKDKWLKLYDVNFIIASWEGGNQGDYERAVANTKILARQITVLIYYLAKLNQLDLSDKLVVDNLQFVGHSLGAHTSGFVGKDFNGLIGRITGLDPAGPQFYDTSEKFRLDKSDGQLVDVLHTNGGLLSGAKFYYGIEKPIGHLDYYANDGKHQPQCKFDFGGCSHGASFHYYKSLLDQEIHTRDYLGGKYHKSNRLFAISSSKYENFHNGLSLSQSCPKTVLDDNDLFSEDINNCVVPIDFITHYTKFRQELIDDYRIDFSNKSEVKNSYYFYTSPAFPYVNNQNLIKIRVSKSDQRDTKAKSVTSSKSFDDLKKICDIVLHVKMASGVWLKNEIKSYQLLDSGDHYEIIVPYISTESASKYELARLDANDFYLNETDSQTLISKAKAAFPRSIQVTGLLINRAVKEKNTSIFSLIKNLFTNSKIKADDEESESQKVHQCSLDIETIAIQPLKKIHRHFVASYPLTASNKLQPDLVILKDGDKSPKIDLLHGRSDTKLSDTGSINSEIYIDTIIIGPRDGSIDNEDFETTSPISSDEYERFVQKLEPPLSEWSLWAITIMVIVALVIGLLVVRPKKLRGDDVRILVNEGP